MLTIEQVKRIWRNRKAHVREAILKEKRYRSSTGGGLDPVLEKSISTTLSSLSQAETLLARTLGREAVMAGLGNMETYVDKVKGGGYRGEMQGECEGGESNFNMRKKQSHRYCDKDNFGDNVVCGDQWREARGDAGRKEDGGAIRLKRVQEQLNDFDSDVSSISPPKRRKYTDREVNKFQMEVLKEERALIAKKSLLLDKQLELLGEMKEMISETLQILRGKREVKKSTKQIEPWNPLDGDPNIAESVESTDL
ncbi:unnamed protein product [Cylicocyclus nassatus]|uniref:Uncharacterized protein n=1 Tax=Cylicocyclus nassatus TaxID=53992 RepID=A0AA36DS02_CYLNA|nr:unnamed protein product [Cylicocyclus nassatus]